MTSPVINQDMMVEILSRLPTSVLGKSRLLNKEWNKKTYESWFLNLNLRTTNSISGYLVVEDTHGSTLKTDFVHEMKESENNKVSFEFLPQGETEIKACDTSHGILLCLNETGPTSAPKYIVCKPTTKQFQIIPQPNMRNYAASYGLSVSALNPFRYKIVRLSQLPCANRSRRTLACEVFNSCTFTWKRVKNLRLPKTDGLINAKPVQASGSLHWLSWDENVVRFCLKTETWSFFPTPKFGGVSPKLVQYEGKLGVIRFCGYGEGLNRLSVLKSSFGRSWVKVKDFENLGACVDVLWTPSNDVVTLNKAYGFSTMEFYNTNTKELKAIQINEELKNYTCYPFCSDYEKVDMDERRDVSENRSFVETLCIVFFFFLFLSSFIQS